MDVEFLRHQFEDGHDGVVVRHRFKLGLRHVQIVYMFVCACVLGAARASTGLAVLALADPARVNDTYIQVQSWDRRVQGAVLSSYLLGHAGMLVPATLLVRRVSGKYVMTAALLITGALAVAMPTIVNKGGWAAMCNAHLWLGAAQACLSPSNHELLVRWLPPSERSMFGWLVDAGVVLGAVVSLPLTARLARAALGWELVFYSQALGTLSLAVSWALLTAGSPDQHEAVGDKEKEFIRENSEYYKKSPLRVPWSCLLRSRPFWAVVCAQAASSAVFVFFLVDVPAYLHTFGASLNVSAGWAAAPFACMWLSQTCTASTVRWLGDTLTLGFKFNLTYYRKLVNAVGALGVVAGLFLAPNLPWSPLSVVVLSETLAMLGFQYNGFLETYKDMSQNFPGSLVLVSSAAASVPAALVPFYTGMVIGDEMNDPSRWRTAFYSVAGVYVAWTALYTALATSERQRWDGGTARSFGYHNGLVDTGQVELEEVTGRARDRPPPLTDTLL